MRFSDERAPLEMTKSSSKQTTLVCPHCRYSRTTSISTVSVICGKCKKSIKGEEITINSN